MRIAFSTASAPALVKNTFSNPPLATSITRLAASFRAILACCGATVVSTAACS